MITGKVIGEKEVIEALKQYGKSAEQGIRKEVFSTAMNVQNEAKDKVPIKKGLLRNSIKTLRANDGLSAKVDTGVNYAAHVEFGTKAHKIRVKNAKVLTNYPFGKEFFGREVNHPGTKPQPFLFPALEKYRNDFLNNLKTILNTIKK